MKASKGKTIFTIETIQRTTIRSRKTAEPVLCEQCAAVIDTPPAAHVSVDRADEEVRKLVATVAEQTENE